MSIPFKLAWYFGATEPTSGFLSDHYDPFHRVLRLSEDVYHGRSLAALGVAAHEAGHAIQHAHAYGPLKFRSLLVKPASIGSNFGVNNTAALPSKRINDPSLRRTPNLVRTTTASYTSPFFTLPRGIASLMLTLITSPT